MSLGSVQRVCDHYFPPINDYSDAVAALASSDPMRTSEQTFELETYIASIEGEDGFDLEDHVESESYTWCRGCRHMISDRIDHVHCTGCRTPFEDDGNTTIYSCGECSDCCEHSICNRCDDHSDHANCEHCDCCHECCSCVECQNCSRLVSCDECECCERCCDCLEEVDDIGSFGKAWIADRAHLKTFKLKRLAGVEWEYNSMTEAGRDTVLSWKSKWDGRIHKDGSCGFEAVTPPISGDFIGGCLRDLDKSLQGAEIDDRCGLHVHVDARDYSWHDMYKLLKVFAKYEAFMYLLSGQQRMINEYSEPCGKAYMTALESDDPKGGILSTAISASKDSKQGRKDVRFSCKKDGVRYRSLNIMPWITGHRHKRTDSTVEFRMHRNTNDVERVIAWTQLCVSLVDWCHNASDKEINELPDSALVAFATIIAPHLRKWLLNRVRDWRQATCFANDGVRRVRFRKGKYVMVPRPENAMRWVELEPEDAVGCSSDATASLNLPVDNGTVVAPIETSNPVIADDDAIAGWATADVRAVIDVFNNSSVIGYSQLNMLYSALSLSLRTGT